MATVAAIMRAQLMEVPFENLDIQAGRTISMNADDIVDKIIGRYRGGYCFEVNGLFSMALEALHIPYRLIAARPMTHQGIRKPKTHMALVVQCDDEHWLCDCGFGGYGIRAPLRLSRPGVSVDQDGEFFKVSLSDEGELTLSSLVHDVWEDQYAFDLTPHHWIDFIPANYYNSTHPDSLFVKKLLIVRCTDTGRKILFGNSLKIVEGGRTEKLFLHADNRAQILREHFGLTWPLA